MDAAVNFRRCREFPRVVEDAKFDVLFLADTPRISGSDDKAALRGSTRTESFEPFTPCL